MVVEAAPSAIIMVDQEGRIVLVNGQIESLFGYARDQLVGQPIEMLIGAGEDFLEDVLGILVPQPEGLGADGVHVAGEAVDELAPRSLVAGAAARYETGVGKGCKLHGNL